MSSDPQYDLMAIYRKKRYWLRKYLFHAVTTYNGIAPRVPGMVLPRLVYDDIDHDNIDYPVSGIEEITEPYEGLNFKREPILYEDKPLKFLQFIIIGNPMAKHLRQTNYPIRAAAPAQCYYKQIIPSPLKPHVIDMGFTKETLASTLPQIHKSCLEAYRHYKNLRIALDRYLRENLHITPMMSAMYDRMGIKHGLLVPPKYEFTIPSRVFQMKPELGLESDEDP